MKCLVVSLSIVAILLQTHELLAFQSNLQSSLYRNKSIQTLNVEKQEIPNEEVQSSRRDFLTNASIILGSTTIVGTTMSTLPLSADAKDETISSSQSISSIDVQAIIQKSSKKALGGGKAGALAAFCQVLSLMWLRTSMNYQYKYGGTLSSSLSTLYNEGGIQRLYQGLPFAIVQGPLTRFGDTAANVGILALLESIPETSSYPLFVKTFIGSCAAGTWRIFCMPIDTCKTVMQVEGTQGLEKLKVQVWEDKNIQALYSGSLASAAATAAGHFPWYLTFNTLNDMIPTVNSKEDLLLSLCRSAFLGLSSSCVSDCVSNSLRVLKTTKQTYGEDISYQEVFAYVIEKDGVSGLFVRGLKTRLITNMIQGAVFSVLWKYFQTI